MAVTLPLEPLRREPAPEAERILVLNFVSTQAQAKGVARSANREGGQTGAAVAKTSSTLPSPTADGWTGCTFDLWRSTPSLLHN
jgi:hypothetical protein